MKNITPLIFLLFSLIATSTSEAQKIIDPGAMMLTENPPTLETNPHLFNNKTVPSALYEESNSFSRSTAADTTAPIFENGTPSAENIVRTSFTLKTDIDEAGTIYYVILADGSTAPTASEVKAGTGSGGAGVINSGSQSVSSGDFSHDFITSGMIGETDYDVYVVAEDDEASPNLQTSPTLLEITTNRAPFFVIDDPTVVEGDSGTSNLVFTVTLSLPAPAGGATIDVETRDGTASFLTDFTPGTATLSLNAGETQVTHTVPIIGDTNVEADETVKLRIKNPTGTDVILGDTEGEGTITNDDSTTVTIDDISEVESGTFTLTLTSDAIVDGGFTVNVSTADDSATAGDDYTPLSSQAVTFDGTAGETETITITVVDDNEVELSEIIDVSMVGSSASTVDTSSIIITDTATATITNNDNATVTITDVTPNENDGTVDVNFTLDNPVDGGFSVNVSTADNTATTADLDYTAISGQTITFDGTGGEVETVTVSLGADAKVEANEIIDLSMGSLVPVTVNSANINVTDTGTVTITNDDTATVTIANVSGNEDNGAISVSVTVDNPVDGGFSLEVSTTDGTATIANSDYTAVTAQTLTFAGTAGETETFDVTPTADVVTEADETVAISMSNKMAGTVSTADINITDTAEVTILNDDNTSVSIDDPSITEGDSGSAILTFTVTLDQAAIAGGASVDYATSNGTAAAGTDYTAASGTLTFGVGETSKTIDVTISGDETVELDETIVMTLSNPMGTGVVIADATGTGTITNDDNTTVTITDVTPNEDVGTVDVSFTLSNAVDGGFSVNVSTTDNTATTADLDYTAISGQTITFDGITSEVETVTITLGTDTKVEVNEIIDISMSGLSPAIVSSANIDVTDTGTVTITNDDTATVTIANVSGNEDDGAITVSVTVDNAVDGGFSLEVSTADGTATIADSDYTAVLGQTLTFAGTAGEIETFDVTPTSDTTPEADETVTVSMSNKAAGIVSLANIDITDTGTVTILEDDTVFVSVDDPSVAEGDSGSAVLTFTLSLSDPAPSGGANVDFATSNGTATSGSDYTATSGTVSFAVGETSKTVDVTIAGDAVVEADETITLTLSNPTGGTVINDGTGIGTITNDDSAAVTIANVAVNEDTGTATITLSLDAEVDGGFSVDAATADGTATTADSDYTPVTGQTETFDGTSGETETFTVTLGTDTKVELDETVIISMSNLSPVTVASGSISITDTATLTLNNDDSASVTIADVAVNEDDGVATITLSLDADVDGGFSVNTETSDGTATTADSDYTAVSGQTETFTGTSGETQTFDITIGTDSKVEIDETVNIAMSNLVPTTVASASINIADTAMLTINNDDAATVTIADVAVNEATGTAMITATLSADVDGGFTVDVNSTDGTATTADSDYTPVSETLTFTGSSGETQNFTVTISDDSKVEVDETLSFSMSNLAPGTVGLSDINITDTATLTINNDDSAILTVADVNGNEDDGNITITVTLDNPVDGGFTVEMNSADGTATLADVDYTAVTGEILTFAGTSGETQTFTLTPASDTKVEADETVTISMANVTPGTVLASDISSTDTATLTINNDDSAALTIADVNGNEDDGSITMSVTLDNPVDGGFTIDVNTADGTATTADFDYIAVTSQTLTFTGNAGEVRVFDVTPIVDVKVEADENLTVSMNNLQGTSLSVTTTDTATLTINNDDAAAVTIADVAVNEAAGTATITATLNADVAGGFTVDVSSANGTATTGDSDYTAVAETLNFTGTSGETQSFTVTITDDSKVEADETLSFSMSNLVPGTVESSSVTITDTATLTINNDDNATLTITDISGNEDDGDITVTVTSDLEVDGGFTVDINSADGTATLADMDYTAVVSETLTFAGTVGETQQFTITPTSDTKLEANETVTMSMTNLAPNTVAVGSLDITDTGTVTFLNDDSAALTIADVNGNEDDGDIIVTVTLDNAVQGGFTVDVSTTNGTATTTDLDFTPKIETLTFAGTAGETQQLTVTPTADTKVEADEDFALLMTNLQGTSLSVDRTDRANVTINNDDSAAITIADVTVNEADGTATLTATLDNTVVGGFTVEVNSTDGTATTADSDYTAVAETLNFTGTSGETQSFTVTITDDSKVEADETLSFSMSNLVPGTVASSSVTITDTATLTINNDDNATLTITDISGNEDDGDITVTVTSDLEVDGGFTLDINSADGTATIADSDYTAMVSETLTFAGTVGETQQFTITPTSDSKLEANETVTVSMTNLTPNTVAAGSLDITDTGTVTFLNDDSAVLTIADVNGNEDDGDIIVTVTLDNAVQGGFTVDVSTTNGTATTTDLDFTPKIETLTFAGTAGETQQLTVTPTADTKVEADEDFTLLMTNLQGTSLPLDRTDRANVTINNDDSATITIADVTVNEADGTATLTATLDNTVVGGFTVEVNSTDGTATTADNDYTAVTNETLTFAGTLGETQSFTVSIADDSKVEANETVSFSMSNLLANTVSSNSVSITDTATLTINNDEMAALSITNASGDENAGDITVTVTLDNAVQGGFTVDMNTVDGTATLADSDYTAVVSETLTFAGIAGETQTFTISPTDDTKVEGNETITISQNNLAGTSLSVDITNTGTVTIGNDDSANVTIEDVTVNEADGMATLTLSLDNAVDGGFSVDVNTTDGTATVAGPDYIALSPATETFTGTAGETQTVDVTIVNDLIGEETESFTVFMSGVLAGTVNPNTIGITDGATITILDDDAPRVVAFTPLDDSVDVAVDTNITLTFDQNVFANTGSILIKNLSDDSVALSIDVNSSEVFVVSNVVIITPAAGLPDSSDLYIEIPENIFLGATGQGSEAFGNSTTWNFSTEDITPPSIVVSTTSPNPTNSGFLVTFTFSEPVTGWDLTDIDVVNGTASIFNQISPTVFTAQIAPIEDGDILISVLADELEDFAGNNNVASNILVIAYDATDPVVDISTNITSDPTNLNPIQATFTISEEVSELDPGDLILNNATINNFTMVSSTVYTMSVFPDADGLVTIGLRSDSVEDPAGNTNDQVLFSFTYDSTSPFFNSITSTSPSPTNAAFSVQFTTNEPISGFTIDDLIVTNGEASNFVEVSPQEYTALITPTISVNDNITIDINQGAAQDAAGNPTLPATQFSMAFDDIRPTIGITVDVADPTNTDFIATITFSEDVTGFDVSDIEVENAATGTFTSISASVYTVEIAPVEDGTVSIDIAEDVAEDAATNGNEAADQFSIEYDTIRPTVEINSSANDPVNSAFEITMTFDEEVFGFEVTDLILINAEATNLTPVSGLEYTATITPITNGSVSVEIPENIAEDAATNGNEASDVFEILFDATRPIPIITSSVPDPTNGTFEVTITFDEPVTGLATTGIDVGNGTADSVTGSGTTYMATITPLADGIVTVIVPVDVTTDPAGNGNEVSNEFSVEFDGTNPTADMSSSATGPINTPFTLDIIFNENVFGFEMSDLVVTNGTPSAFNDPNLATYSVIITPDGGGDITVEIPVGVTEDLATNPNNFSSFTIAYDASAPVPPMIASISEYTCSDTTMVTGDNTLEIFGTAELGSTVEMFLNGTSIGTVATDTNGDFTFDYTGITLADGDYTFTARAIDSAMNTSALSAGFDITINTVDLDGNGIADFCDGSTPQDCDGDGVLNQFDDDNSGCRGPIQTKKTYGISPNGDRNNDAWVIQNITAFPRNVVSLYNRSGKLVFRQRNYNNNFIGISNQLNGNRAIRLPVGPYIFLIDLGDGSPPTRGWLYVNY